jgi:hypothetical protein
LPNILHGHRRLLCGSGETDGTLIGVERVAIALAVIFVAGLAALLVQRRRPDPPAQAGWAVPAQLDRNDFNEPATPWLVVVFTSATCDSCADTWEKARQLASREVAVQEVEAVAHRDLHRRYGIEAVPMIVVADADGVVRWSFLGPPGAAELWAAVAEVRDGRDNRPTSSSPPTA